MNAQHYPNLTVIDDSEIQSIADHIEERALIARLPQSARNIIEHIQLRDAIQESFQIDIKLEDISQYNSDYIIMLHSANTKNILLNKGFLKVDTFTLPLIPWDRDYGSTIMPLPTYLTDTEHQNQYSLTYNREQLTIDIFGRLPPHLCCEFIVRHLLKILCVIHEVTFTPAILVYSVDAYGSKMCVPNIAYIGVKKTTQNGISMWPLWYETITEDMHGYPCEPYYLHNTGNFEGDSDLDSEHRREVHKQYYDLQDGNNEMTSRLKKYVAGFSDDSDWEPYAP